MYTRSFSPLGEEYADDDKRYVWRTAQNICAGDHIHCWGEDYPVLSVRQSGSEVEIIIKEGGTDVRWKFNISQRIRVKFEM